MKKIICENCGDTFTPDDENDIYCCEQCEKEADSCEDEEE